VLEVPGWRSGEIRRNALVMASHNGDDYLVALAGESEGVRNVRSADGHVVMGRRERRGLHFEAGLWISTAPHGEHGLSRSMAAVGERRR
jgi:hypothetical protein